MCVLTNQKSGSGDIFYSVDHHVSGCEYFVRCLYVWLFVTLNQQHLIVAR